MGNAVTGKKKDELEDPEEILRKAQKKVDEVSLVCKLYVSVFVFCWLDHRFLNVLGTWLSLCQFWSSFLRTDSLMQVNELMSLN